MEPATDPRADRRRGRRYNRFWQWVDEHSPTEPAWLLDSVAIEPAVQGRGFGSALITAGLDRARTDGQGAYLSTGTERNVTIYERLGFRVVKAIDCPTRVPASGSCARSPDPPVGDRAGGSPDPHTPGRMDAGSVKAVAR